MKIRCGSTCREQRTVCHMLNTSYRLPGALSDTSVPSKVFFLVWVRRIIFLASFKGKDNWANDFM